MAREINRVQSKDQNIVCIELLKFLCLCTMIGNMYLKIDITGYLVFINLLVNNFIEYRQFILIFVLRRIPILLKFFYRAIKKILNLFFSRI